jgi:hypothetical protein
MVQFEEPEYGISTGVGGGGSGTQSAYTTVMLNNIEQRIKLFFIKSP